MTIRKILSGLIFVLTCNLTVSGQVSLVVKETNPQQVIEMAYLIQDWPATDDTVKFRKPFDVDKYQKIYTSPELCLDNVFRVYRHKRTYVLNFRASQLSVGSWMENIYTNMIPASGQMQIDGAPYTYNFSNVSEAAVHSGFALAIVYMREALMEQIEQAHKAGMEQLIIIGHSQGGALANMLYAHIRNNQDKLGLSNIICKSYTFGAPMIGNKAFAASFNAKLSGQQQSYNIANKHDIVATLPLQYNEADYWKIHLEEALKNDGAVNWLQLGKDFLANEFEESLQNEIRSIGFNIEEQVERYSVPIELPEAVNTINFEYLSNKIEIDPMKISNEKAEEEEENTPDELKGWMPRGEIFYQHHAKVYYRACLKHFYPDF